MLFRSRVLGAVKTEFAKFGAAFENVQKKIREADNALNDAQARTRAMQRRLRDVEELSGGEAAALLGTDE